MFIRGRVRSVLLGCASAAVLVVATGAANAGGFALREQSAYGQGSSYAGVAAGGSLSSMFWNPATMTQFNGVQSESVFTGVFPSATNNATSGTLVGTGNIAHSAIVPSGYYSWQISRQVWLGLSMNSPFGLSETFPDAWAGRAYGAGGSHLTTYNATPSIAYEINQWLSIGAGVQIQYADATLTKGIGAAPSFQSSLDGAGWGYGFTAGLTVKPSEFTTIGLGYRSSVNQKINGTLALPGGPFFNPPFSTPGSVSTTIDLPDVVSLGIRHQFSPQWTGMATVEWTNWSRIGTSPINQPNGQQAVVLAGLGGGPAAIPFEYKDGWFYSLGAEYVWNERTTLRGGVAYEKSPITDQVRTPVVPDNDRFWLSVGASYKFSPKLTLDFAYSHLFVRDTPINISSAANPNFNGTVYTGSVDAHIDIVSVGIKYRWDDPVVPVKQVYHK